jgi:hypothetical protein
MEKMSNPDNNDDEDDIKALSKVEGIILDRLISLYNKGIVSIGYQKLKDSIDNTITSENFDTSLEDMVAQSLIQYPDGENYEITGYGIKEYERRKTEGTLY